jgi:hypothetical protein
MFLNYFDMLISKIIFKNKKKYYWHIFLNKKHFEKQPQPLLNTLGETASISSLKIIRDLQRFHEHEVF